MISMRCSLLLICVSFIIIDEIQSKPHPANQNDTDKVVSNMRRGTGRMITKDNPPMSNRHRRQIRFNQFEGQTVTKRTKDGIVYSGGFNLPSIYSGSADFAFDGESIRPLQFELKPQTTTEQIINWENAFNPEGLSPDWINQIPSGNSISNPSLNWQNQNSQLVNANQNGNTSRDTPGRPNPCQVACHQTVTSQYSPVCGSDNITYTNFEKFRCAQKCGRQITGRQYVSCGLGRPVV